LGLAVVFRKVSSAGKAWGEGVTEKLVWHVVKEFAAKVRVTSPHDLRRTCAASADGELEQIQFLLAMFRFKPPNATSAAHKELRQPSMTRSESSPPIMKLV
jgi:hypothetical protein